MKIPQKLKLHGQEIVVNFDNLLLHKSDNRGEACYRDSVIKLQSSSADNPIPQQHTEEAFCHELMHFLFHHAGYHDDRSDEDKVWRMGLLLHQALTTMEYE